MIKQIALGLRQMGIVLPPTKLAIEHTTECNLHCKRCARNIKLPAVTHMPKKDIFRMVKKLPFVKTVSFEGLGESFCHPEMYEILEGLKNKKVRVISNALLIDVERVKKYKNLTIIISPYGPEQLRIAGELVDAGVNVEFNTVLFPEKENPEKLITIAEKLGVSRINYSHPQCFLDNVKHYDDTNGYDDVAFNLWSWAKWYKGVKVTYPPKMARRSPCLYPWYVMRVDVVGDVYPCSYLAQSKTGVCTERYLESIRSIDQTNLLMGNIYNQNPNDIWHSKKWKQLRRAILKYDAKGISLGNLQNKQLMDMHREQDLSDFGYCAVCLHKWGKAC